MQQFPFTLARPISFNDPVPAACDVVVIGGGVVGVMTAWYLAEQGQRVVLCEKGRIAAEQSSRNWGWIRQQGRDPAELSIMVESLRIWKSLAQELGADLGFRQEGVIYAAKTEAEMAGFEAWLSHARDHGLDTHMMSAGDLAERMPEAAKPWKGGIFTPSDARAEPWVAVPMLAQGAQRRGAILVENCAVRGLDIAGGKVAGVVTERGRIACAQVVLAAGAWSALFARAQGIALPQLSVRATVAATAPLPDVFAGNVADDDFAFRRRADGGYTLAPGAAHDFYIGPDAFRNMATYLPVLKKDFRSTRFHLAAPKGYPDAWSTPRKWALDAPSPFEAMRILNPAPNLRFVVDFTAHFAKTFPHLPAPKITTAWAGMIDTMPDVVPVIDRVAALSGLILATGMSGHGFGIGPGIGRVVADLVTGRALGHELHRFRLARFTDGSKIAPGPSL